MATPHVQGENTVRTHATRAIVHVCLLFLAAGCGGDRPPLIQGLLRDRMVARLDAAHSRAEALRDAPDAWTRRGATSCLAEEAYLRHRVKVQIDRNHRQWGGIRRSIEALEKDTGFLEKGGDLIARKRGTFLQAYVSHIDGSVQPYSIGVPAEYTGGKPFPLVVRLHGHGGFRPFQGHPVSVLRGAISVAPHGRGASDYMGMGEDDVLQVLADVQRSHRIDPDRIYLIGHSMGGTGCWALACRHPQLFAGIVPIAGNADYRVWEREWLWKRRGAFEELREFLRAADSPITFAGNLINVPAVCVHGGGDTVVPPGHARSMVGAVKAAGGNVRYLEFLGAGHGRFPANIAQLALAEIASHVRTPVPRKVLLTSENLRHGRAHWIEIVSITQYGKLASAAAELSPNARVIRLRTENVQSVAVHLDSASAGFTAPVDVLWNDTMVYRGPLPRPGGKPLVLQRPGRPRPTGLRKQKGLEGPVSDVFLDSFIIVKGTGDCPRQQREVEEREIRHFCGEWERRYGAVPRVKADQEIGPDDMRTSHLVIFGGPQGNSFYQSIAAQLPIRVDPEKGTVTCPNGKYKGGDVGAIFCYPNPANPRKLVAVFSGASWWALYQISSRFGNWFDWGIFDGRKWFDYAVFDARTKDPETYLECGFFGPGWTHKGGKRWKGLQLARMVTPRMRVPGLALPPGNRVALSALMPEEIDQMRGAVGFDRSFRGNHMVIGNSTYSSGLGVRAPSRIVYKLPDGFRRLSAVVGLDRDGDEVAAKRWAVEKAKFVVEGDGKVLFETQQPVSWRKNAVAVDVDISAVTELVLRVKRAGGPVWLQGSAAWANAYLER